MKKILKPISIFLCVSVMASCASVPYKKTADGLFDTYLQKNFRNAILNYGPPSAVYKDGDGGRILSWEYSTSYTKPGVSYSMESGEVNASYGWDEFRATYNSDEITLRTPPRTYTNTKYIQFYVHENGDIYHYRHNIKSEAEKKAEDNKVIGQTLAIVGVVVVLGIAASVSGTY